MAAQGETTAQTTLSLLQQRREDRRRKDAHHHRPFRRLFIGPSPVDARSATSVASAIAQDVQIEHPTAISVIGAQGAITSGGTKAGRRGSADSTIMPSHISTDRRGSVDATTTEGDVSAVVRQGRSLANKTSKQSLHSHSSPSSSPVRLTREISPLHVPRIARPSRRLSRAESADGADRRSFVSFDDDGLRPFRSRSGRRQMSQSEAGAGRSDGETSGVKFDLLDPRQRRQRSESSAFDGPNVSKNNRPVLPLLDISVDEEGSRLTPIMHSSPERTRFQSSPRRDRNLRNTPSYQSVGAQSLQPKPSSSTIIVRSQGSSEGLVEQEQSSSRDAVVSSDPQSTEKTENTGDVLTDTDTTARRQKSRMDEIRDRARERYLNSKMGQSVAFSSVRMPRQSGGNSNAGGMRQHVRDASRQSRLSYVSAAGTQTSVGTRLTEGSFGASGGFRAKLIRSFRPQSRRTKTPTSQSVRAEARRHGLRSSSSRGGVVPGAVGTSSGGTKWVGQTFEVGKRFGEAMDNREELLCGGHGSETVLEAVREEDDVKAKRNAKQSRSASEAASMTKSPDDVLLHFAREASDGRTEGVGVNGRGVLKRSVDSAPGKLTATRNMSDSTSAAEVHPLGRVQSAASLVSVPQDREVTSGWDIESRSGWNDVKSFITAQSNLPASIQRSARSAGDNVSEMGNRARRAWDGQLSEFRNRQQSAKHARGQGQRALQNDVSRFTIDEAGSGAESGTSTPTNKPKTALTARDVLQQPEAPVHNDEKIVEATFELTRRPSLPGLAPDGQANDAASDHQVAAQPTFEHTHGHAPRSQVYSSPTEMPSDPLSELPSAFQRPSELSSQKKNVQFKQLANGSAPPQRSMTLGAVESTGASETVQMIGGRIRPLARSGNAAPAPPEEVLSRNGTPDEKTGELARLGSDQEEVITSRSALRRDRMLVKVAWTPSEDVHKEFTERESRKYELHADPFREYMVVYRTGRLELWDDPSWAARVLGKGDELKLRYVAPLRRGRAFVSLYSPIDTIFCLSFIPDHNRSLFNLRRSGTHIWLFDARTTSNGADWMWDLWREVGGEIPDAIDVHIPIMGTRVRIPIPEEMPIFRQGERRDDDLEQGGEGFKILTPTNVIHVVAELLRTFSQWSDLREAVERSGMRFGLAWRSHLQLNWVQHAVSMDGSRRDWAVLVGSILCDSKSPSSLEFRGMVHYPSTVKTAQGIELEEPTAVEGFIWRVKAVSGALTRLYLTTQDGFVFINRSSRAFPPERLVASDPHLTMHQLRRSGGSLSSLNDRTRGMRKQRRGSRSSPMSNGAEEDSAVLDSGEETLQAMGRRVMDMITLVPVTLEELDAQREAYKAFEKRRLFEQITNSDGYIDVCDIFMIKSLDDKGIVRRPSSDSDGVETIHTPPKGMKQGDVEHDAVNTPDEGSDEEDVGGEEGYVLAKDRVALKRARQFDVVLSNGRSIRFEAYSKSVAREWINRIADLSRYWKRRDKVDALEKMNASGYDPKLIQRKVQMRHEPRPLEQAADSERLAPLLGNVWNWCVLDACRTIVRSGRLFTKKKPYTAFASRYCILVSGRLLTYKLMTSTRTARARQNAGIFHKRQETVIHLHDSYVYSGKLTDHMLVNGRSDGAGAISSFGGGTGGASTSSTRHTLPRVYADGLLSVDEDEECTFVIRYRPQRVNRAADPQLSVDSDMLSSDYADVAAGAAASTATRKQAPLTTLRDSTVNVIAMRARSRLERDLWVWAINAERERIARDDKTHEVQVRQNGKTPFRHH